MLRQTLRRLRFTLVAVITTVVIALAVLVGLTQLAMPWLVRNPERIEAWLSQRLHQPVHIGRVAGAWIGGGPVLTLDDVTIGAPGAGKSLLEVSQAELALDFYAPLRRNRAWSEFRLVGVEVQLVHDADGWHVRGFDLGNASGSRGDMSMGALGALVFRDLKLSVEDEREDLHLALAASELRVLNQGDVTHIAGKVRNLAADSTPIDLIADVDINRRSGTLYAGGSNVDLGRFAAQRAFGGIQLLTGSGEARIWVQVSDGRVDDLRLRVDLRDAAFAAVQPLDVGDDVSVLPRTHLDRIAFVARWLRESTGWSADVAELVLAHGEADAAPARLAIERRGADDATTYRAAVANLAVEPLASLAMLSGSAPAGLRRWLYHAHPQGVLSSADLRWRSVEDFDVDAMLSAGGFADAGSAPGIDRFDAAVIGDAQAVMLQLPPQALRIDYPHVFRKPFQFSHFGGDIVAFRTDDAWRLETDRVAFEGEGFGGELRGGAQVQDDHTRPLLDLYALVTHADVAAAKLFWPTPSMSPQAIAFLDRALVSGRLENGRVLVRGDLDSWPFHDNMGRFEARGHVVDTTFDYNPEWPRAEHLQATANFIGNSMQVDVESAEVKDIRVTDATAVIPDLGNTVLELSAKGSGSGANLLAFVRDAPIGKRHEDVLKDISIGGKGDLDFKMSLPVKDTSKLVLDGNVELVGANLDDAAFNLHFVDASGSVRFNQTGFAAGPLAVQFRQRAAKLALASGGYVEDARHIFEANLKGRFPVTTVFADVSDIAPVLPRFPGESDWTASVNIDAAAANGTNRKQLLLSSDLRGTAIDLPAPLEKAADAARPFQLAFELPFLGAAFTAKLGDLVAARGTLPAPTKPFAARVDFGGQPTASVPARGIVIGGRVSTFDAGGWLELARLGDDDAGSGSGGGNLLQQIDLGADEFSISERSFGAMRIAMRDNKGVTELKLDGTRLAGTLQIPGQGLVRQGITARFERFHWPEGAPDAPDAPDSDTLANVAPATLPPLHISVDDFLLGQASFGAAQFESYPSGDGMHIEKLDTKSANINMSASGDWTGTTKDNRSHLLITLTAQNLGHMMDALGFPGIIDGGQTIATIDAVWPGPPSAFALSKVESGTITLKVAEGRIPEVHPGAGRIFGLLSLSEIPRRLSLDFSDFFQSGLGFNSITGTFRLENGNAYTTDLTIKSPAADIVITGRTGLRSKDYDQEMVVSPHTSATLPIVGAIAGGPVGAAAGLVLQGVLGKPMGRALGSRYKVSGSWDKPQITLVAREKTGIGNRESGMGKAKPDEAEREP
jgi:uncharacterized protein (TIGR02099 family)